MVLGYRVSVEELTENLDNSKYPNVKTVYEQSVEALDIPALVIFINQGKE